MIKKIKNKIILYLDTYKCVYLRFTIFTANFPQNFAQIKFCLCVLIDYI